MMRIKIVVGDEQQVGHAPRFGVKGCGFAFNGPSFFLVLQKQGKFE